MSVATSALLISDSLSYCAQRQGEAQRRCVRASVSGNSLERSCRITLDLGSNGISPDSYVKSSLLTFADTTTGRITLRNYLTFERQTRA